MKYIIISETSDVSRIRYFIARGTWSPHPSRAKVFDDAAEPQSVINDIYARFPNRIYQRYENELRVVSEAEANVLFIMNQ